MGKGRIAAIASIVLVLAMSLSMATVHGAAPSVPFIIVGDRLSGNESVALAGNVSNVEHLDVTLEGRSVGSASAEPFVVWIDTTTFCDGEHNLSVSITYNGGATQRFNTTVEVRNQNWGLGLVAFPLAALAAMMLLFTLAVGMARRKNGGEK